MFKEERETWLYFIGIIVMIILLVLFTTNIWIPLLSGKKLKDINPASNLREQPVFTIDTNLDYLANIDTSLGTMTIDLHEKNSPNNVNNFIYLSSIKYYENNLFFRLIPNLLIQAGDPNAGDDNYGDDGYGHPGYVVDDEINFETLNINSNNLKIIESKGYKTNSNVVSENLTELSVAMANVGPNSNSSQFFIVLARKGDSRLEEMNGRFTVIGKVISGLDIIQQMRNTRVNDPNLLSPRPVDDIVIKSVKILTR